MKQKQLLFAFTLCAAVVGFFFFRHRRDNTHNITKAFRPMPSANQPDELFKSIAGHTGIHQAVINIVNDGNYALPGENFTFNQAVYATPFKVLDRIMKLALRTPHPKKKAQWEGYLKVHRVEEELSKQMLVFLSLVLFPGFQNKRLVVPSFNDGKLRTTEKGKTPFDVLFNLEELNRYFASNDYPPIVSYKDYNRDCKDSKYIYVINFIHSKYTNSITKKLYEEGKGERWIDCDLNKKSIVSATNTLELSKVKVFCTTWNFNISTLPLHKDAKCFEVPVFLDHGLRQYVGPDRLSPSEIFNYLLNPSDMIINEASTFTKQYLKRPYVAIHIRGGHINKLPTTVDRCYILAMRIVAALKERRGIKSVYLSTDMNEFGCQGSFEPGHEEYLAKIGGAVRYKPNATGNLQDVSRTSVALTNVLLLAKSDHLIAIGVGSFHNHVMRQFLKHHYGMDPKVWSMIRMCENARGAYKRPTIKYPIH